MDTGDTAWMLMSTALVMIMLPGLALFYGGLVRRKNVLSTVMHSFFGLALVSIVWVIVGFTLAFGPDVNWHRASSATSTSRCSTASARSRRRSTPTTIPFMLFAMFQLMFAAITPALITGAFAERKRFGSFVLFTILWSILIYSPIAHWVWSVDGWLFKLGALDFAGGTVVHISSGVSALVVALMIGRRHMNGDSKEPHDVPMTVLGAGLLWFGWFGFNAGSAVTAGGLAASAFTVTNIAAAAATITWVLASYAQHAQGQRRRGRLRRRRRPRRDHPGVGLRHPGWRAHHRSRRRRPVLQRHAPASPLPVDDALDVFAVHGVGGMFGAIATGIFASTTVQAAYSGLLDGNPQQLVTQAVAVGATVLYAAVGDRRHRQGRRPPARHPGQARGRGDGARPLGPRRGRLPGVTSRGRFPARRHTDSHHRPPSTLFDGGRSVPLRSTAVNQPAAAASRRQRPRRRHAAVRRALRARRVRRGVRRGRRAGGRGIGCCRWPSRGWRRSDTAARSERTASRATARASSLPLDRSLLALLAGDAAAGRPGVVSLFLPRGRGARAARRVPWSRRLRRGRADDRRLAGRPVRPVARWARPRPLSRPAFAQAIVARPSRAAERSPGPSRTTPSSDGSSSRAAGSRRRPARPAARSPRSRCRRRRRGRSSTRASSSAAGCPTSIRTSGRRWRPLRRLPPALRHEHASGLAPRPAVPLDLPQRRDQHGPRQPRAGPRPAARRGRLGGRRDLLGGRAAAVRRTAPIRCRSTRRLELLTSTGWDLTAALLTAIPEALALRRAPHPHVATLRRRTAGFLAPWDGPAAIVFADGRPVGALVDRNGLRPAAFAVTRDRLVAVASEAGAVPFTAAETVRRGRLGPGELLLVEPGRAGDPRGHRGEGLRSCARCRSTTRRGRSTRTGRRDASRGARRRPPTTSLRYLAGLDAERARLDIKTMALEAPRAAVEHGRRHADAGPRPARPPGRRPPPPGVRPGHEPGDRPGARAGRHGPAGRARLGGRRCSAGRRAGRGRCASQRPIVADLDGLLAARPCDGGPRSGRSMRRGPPATGPAGLAAALDRLAADAVAAARRAPSVAPRDRRGVVASTGCPSRRSSPSAPSTPR